MMNRFLNLGIDGRALSSIVERIASSHSFVGGAQQLHCLQLAPSVIDVSLNHRFVAGVSSARSIGSSTSCREGDETTSSAPSGGDGEVSSSQETASQMTEGEKARKRASELVEKGYTPRQAAWMSPDPEKARLPRLTRKEAGSYGRPDMVSQYVKELNEGMKLPKGVSMYNLDRAMPEILDPKCPEFDAMVALLEENPDLRVEDAARSVGIDAVELDVPSEEEPHLIWTYRNVLVPFAAGESHPVNSKVVCEFHLRSLQEHYGLSDEGVDYVARICDMRYNEMTGMVRLVSESLPSREENRARLETIIKELVAEGMKLGTKPKQKKATRKAKKTTR